MTRMASARRAPLILLVLAIAVAGAFLVWTQVLDRPLPWQEAKPVAAPPPPAPAPPPPAPAPPSAALADIPGAITVVTASRAGVIAELVDDHGKVKEGDVLARFAAPPATTGAQLDAHAVLAPAAGSVRTKVARGDTVAAGAPIATVQAASTLRARFPQPAGQGYALGAEVRVTPKAAPGSKHLTCKVSEVDGASIALTCPNNAGIPNGVEVIIQ